MGLLDPVKSLGKKAQKGASGLGLSTYANAFDAGKLLKNPSAYAKSVKKGVASDFGRGAALSQGLKSGDLSALGNEAGAVSKGLGASGAQSAKLKGAATSAGSAYSAYQKGNITGLAAGAISSQVVSKGAKKAAKAKASKAATDSHGSTDFAMQDKAPRKGIISALLSIFGL